MHQDQLKTRESLIAELQSLRQRLKDPHPPIANGALPTDPHALELFFDIAPSPAAYLDNDSILQRVNPAFASYFGIDQYRASGMAFDSLLPSAVSRQIMPLLHPPADKEALAADVWVDSQTLGRRCLRVASHLMRNSDGAFIGALLFTQDITDAKYVEDRYQQLFEKIPAMMHSINSNGKITSVSDVWLEKLGYTRGEVLGKKSIDFLTEESRHCAQEEALPRFFATGFTYKTPFQMVTKDGRIIDVLLSAISERNHQGEAVRRHAFIEDVTERKKFVVALSQKQRLLNETQAIANVGSYSRDLKSDKVSWSDQQYRLFGYEPGEVTPDFNTVLRHVHDEDKELFLQHNHLLLQEKKPYDIHYRIITKSGATRWVRSKALVEYDERGNPVRLYGALQDITTTKTAELPGTSEYNPARSNPPMTGSDL